MTNANDPELLVMAETAEQRMLRVRGVGRDPDDARTLTVAMSGEFSDDDLRSIHDYLRDWRPARAQEADHGR